MRSSIKVKIILYTTLIITLSLLLSAAYTYKYFSNIIKTQAVKDEKAKLSQTVFQMEYIIEDAKTFSYNILADKDLQSRLKKINKLSTLEKSFEIYDVVDRLKNYFSFRKYVQSVAYVLNDGTSYWSNDPFENNYFNKRMEEDWYQNYRKEHNPFTAVHILPNRDGNPNGEKVISLITPIYDINSPNVNLGELIVNLNYDFFKDILAEGNKDFSDFIWINQAQDVILQKDTSGDSHAFQMLQSAQTTMDAIHSESRVLKEDKEFILISQTMSNGWMMNAFISKKQLFQQLDFIYRFFLLLLIVSVVIANLLNIFVAIGITRPLTKLIRTMRQVSRGNLDVSLSIKSGDEIEEMANVFNRMILDLKGNIQMQLEEERVKKNLEFNLLLLQINPHFIYNTLNTVIYLARIQKNVEIVKMMEAFIKILQETIKLGENGLVNTVAAEKEIIEHYILIQQFRYKDKFSLQWTMEDELAEKFIPKTIIQPLVENAIFHGISPKDSDGVISIHIAVQDQNLLISVADDGIGMDEETRERILANKSFNELSAAMHHIGMANIHARIQYFYGPEYGMDIESTVGVGTRIMIKLPLN